MDSPGISGLAGLFFMIILIIIPLVLIVVAYKVGHNKGVRKGREEAMRENQLKL